MRGTTRFHLIVSVLAVMLMLAACSAMPFSTMWKMRNFSIEDVLALHPEELRVAVAFDVTRMSPGGNRLVLGLLENGKRNEYRFALQNALDTAAPDSDHSWTVMRLTPASVADFAKLQVRVRGDAKHFAFADFNWRGGELDSGKGSHMPTLVHVSVDLRLHPDEWLPLVVDYPVRVEVDQATAPQ